MVEPSSEDVSQLLMAWGQGDLAALEKLTPLVYHELHRLAQHHMRRERREHTLQTTALVNEVYLRLIDQPIVNWRNRAQFFGICAKLIRRILVDYARRRQYAKRAGGAGKVSLEEVATLSTDGAAEVIAVDEALKQLASMDERQSQIVEMRFFGGLTIGQMSAVLHLSPATIEREWKTAKTWLYRELKK